MEELKFWAYVLFSCQKVLIVRTNLLILLYVYFCIMMEKKDLMSHIPAQACLWASVQCQLKFNHCDMVFIFYM